MKRIWIAALGVSVLASLVPAGAQQKSAGKSYARNARFKLTNGGELFDLAEAPYQEISVSSTTTDAAAIAAREQLQEVLKQHPTAPGGPAKKAGKAGKKKARKQG